MKLDIGCGDAPTGDVNCDLFVGETPHLNGSRLKINPKTMPNFVRCTANILPFKDNSFSESEARMVFEHRGVNPIKALSEMIRVTYGKITVIVPHRFWRTKSFPRYEQFPEAHDKLFNQTTLKALFRRFGLNPRITVTKKDIIPFIGLINIPYILKAEVSVR